jgi:hypothetical protein
VLADGATEFYGLGHLPYVGFEDGAKRKSPFEGFPSNGLLPASEFVFKIRSHEPSQLIRP